jgi:hypothetical protein
MNARQAAGPAPGAHARRADRSPLDYYVPGAILLAHILIIALLSYSWFPSLWAVGWAVFDLDQSTGPETGVVLSEVASHPQAMWDRTVTVSADVHDLVNDQSMVIGTSSLFHFRTDTLLVLAPGPLDELANAPLDEDQSVRVTGVVRRYEPAVLEKELGISLDDPSITSHGDKVVLVAQQVEVGLPDGPVPGDPEISGSAGYEIGVTVHDVARHTDEYLGETVTVSDEVEEGFLTDHAFWLGDEKLLVISAKPVPDVFVETTAYATGEVRRFDLKAVEEMTGIDLDDKRFQEFQGKPFILAESVHVLA